MPFYPDIENRYSQTEQELDKIIDLGKAAFEIFALTGVKEANPYDGPENYSKRAAWQSGWDVAEQMHNYKESHE